MDEGGAPSILACPEELLDDLSGAYLEENESYEEIREEFSEDLAEDVFQEPGIDEAIRYAYENNLTTDYTLSSFSITHLLGQPVQRTIPVTNEDDFTGCSHLADLVIPVPSPFDKTLPVTSSSLKLVYDARRVLDDEEVEQLTEQVRDTCTVKHSKFELPILRTDNEWDVIQYQKENLTRNRALLGSIKNHMLPLDVPDAEKGEGMELSPKARADCEAMMKGVDEEKLGVPESMAYLVEEIEFGRAPGPAKITPPVSPQLNQDHYMPAFEPDLFAMPLDLSSTFSENFQAIEDAMLEDHQDAWSDITSPIRGFLEESLNTPDQDSLLGSSQEKLEDLKVEVPLILDRASERPEFSGLCAFKEFVDGEIHLDPEFEDAVLHGFSDDNVEEQVREAAEPIIKSIEQEQLQAIDAIGRVPVPIMDFSIPEPEWTKIRNNASALFKWIQSDKVRSFKLPSWPKHKAAESRLLWLPLVPGAITVSELENMDQCEPLIRQFLDKPDETKSSSLELVQQKHGPAVLEDDEADEEVETQLTGKNLMTDLTEILRKRSMDLAEGVFKKRRRTPPELTLTGIENQRASLLVGGSSGASATLLANFMELHAPKKKVWKQSRYFASPINVTPTLQSPTETSELTRRPHEQEKQGEDPKQGFMAPFPSISPPSFPLTIFISIKVPRRMIRTLEGLVSDLTIFERDHDAHNTSVWRPGSVSRTEIVPVLADDADITVSPTTGLIITSMIVIRQKARAGTSKSMVQIRIEKACSRYEQLIVLVGGEGGSDDTLSRMSPSVTTALMELQGYASGLNSNIQVHYVGGGDNTLAHWVAASICRHSLADPAILSALLEVETLWEVFLRRAGFNVFAAQTVACQLRQPSSEAAETSSKQHGLGAFVTMTRSERVRRFGQLVGPRVLERVSKNLDELWNDV